ncbi:hypothetical protein [Helicobacter cinaedi]|uniref:hypothetical protein n=1 Tax=Helicobacter cinaedi TaxID=213 RepID=UPI000AC7DF08|nr:hypothetical protein [Helicobacter cinaedi]BBB21056.1 hypothetical protein HC081234_22330 [Helicobacter cinaedi]
MLTRPALPNHTLDSRFCIVFFAVFLSVLSASFKIPYPLQMGYALSLVNQSHI